MTNILNKSNHPVEVKRISIRVWKIRDEIEQAIANRISEAGHSNIDIQDLKTFYYRNKPAYLDAKSSPSDHEQPSIGEDGKDSSGNEMDEDAQAMMEALKGDQEQTDEKAPPDTDTEDSEAAKLAAEMLGDQGQAQTGSTTSAQSLESSVQLTRTIPAEDKVSSGFSLLSDLNMDKILLFSQKSFTHGQNVAIEFLIPNHFIISGEIVSCSDLRRNSKIISDSKPNYRLEIELTYLWDGERGNLRNFLKSIEPHTPPPLKKTKQTNSSEENEDEFEDLGF